MFLKYLSIVITVFLVLNSLPINAQPVAHDAKNNTFSIVAHDPATGQVGVAVQSHWFSVGSAVSWAEAGVGAVATQSLTNKSFGPRGLQLLKEGKTPQDALEILIESDDGSEFRQVAIVDTKGRVAVHTGAKCIAEAGHRKGNGFSVQANMMLNNTVWDAMAKTFEQAQGPLAERMVTAMKAAQAAGGDIRGQQSAAIIIVNGEKSDQPWKDRLIELRVEDHPNATNEIARLLELHRAYKHMNSGDEAIEHSDVESALDEYSAAMNLFPKNIEMKYWTAVSLANANRMDKALPLFRIVFYEDRRWIELTQRIHNNGILNVAKSDLDTILSAAS